MVTTLSVRGMTCGNCVRHVSAAVKSVPNVTEVAVDLKSGEVKVTHAGADLDAIIAAIDEAGYGASAVA